MARPTMASASRQPWPGCWSSSVLYPGSDVVIRVPVRYLLDSDDRVRRFFADTHGVAELIGARRTGSTMPLIRIIHGDYRSDLDLDVESFDLLVSLYAGFVSEHYTDQLRIGGTLLVNPSHGDASMASIDDRYGLAGVVTASSGRYRIDRADLGRFLVPKKAQEVTVRLSLHPSQIKIPPKGPASPLWSCQVNWLHGTISR